MTKPLLFLLAASFAVPAQAIADETRGDGSGTGTMRWLKTPAAVRRELRREAADAIAAQPGTGGPAADPARPSVAARTGRVLKTGARMVGDPVFVGAIVLSDLANAGIKGDPDKVGDLGHSLTTPEFYAGIGLFNATHAAADAALNGTGAALAKTRLGAAMATANMPPALAAGGKLLKSNLVLAAALTLPRIVEFDFGGFTAADAAKADFSKLKNTHVGINPKVDGQDLAITLGSFAVAQPVWSGIKRAASFAGKRLLRRLAVTAGIKAASLAVPVGGEVFSVALTIGEVAWFAVDLAGLLMTAHAIEEPVKEWNDQRRFNNAANDAVMKFIAVCKKNGGNPSQKEFDDALTEVALGFRNLRDLHYLPAAFEDASFVNRLSRWGVPKEKLAELSARVTDEWGMDLSPLGQTVILKREYDALFKDPKASVPGRSRSDFEGSYKNYRDHAIKEIKEIYAAPRLPDEALDPISPKWQLSSNRAQLYDQEAAVYARGRSFLKNEDMRKRLADEMAIVGALKEVDNQLYLEAIGELPAPDVDPVLPGEDPSAASGSGTGQVTPTGDGSSGPASPPQTEGMTGTLNKRTK